eukprot:scaffold103430_cov27-Phaeocystis_antarctica.AAC.1
MESASRRNATATVRGWVATATRPRLAPTTARATASATTASAAAQTASPETTASWDRAPTLATAPCHRTHPLPNPLKSSQPLEKPAPNPTSAPAASPQRVPPPSLASGARA